MYAPQLVRVESVGERVLLAIGNWQRSLHFETAVLLAAWMNECARDAKHWAGNRKRGLRAVGTLHDASDAKWLDAGQPFDPNRLFPVNRDVLKAEQISVRQAGGTVVLKFIQDEAAMPYAAALQISQWIRLKAKESQQRAGDKRHWGKIVEAHQEIHGPGVTHG